jgi:hypothetical protein
MRQIAVLPDVQDRGAAQSQLEISPLHRHRDPRELPGLHLWGAHLGDDNSERGNNSLCLRGNSSILAAFEVRVLRQEQRLHLKRPRVEQSDRAQRLRVRQRLQEQIPTVPLNSFSPSYHSSRFYPNDLYD